MAGFLLGLAAGFLAGLLKSWWIWSGAPRSRDPDALAHLRTIGAAYLRRHRIFAGLLVLPSGVQPCDQDDVDQLSPK